MSEKYDEVPVSLLVIDAIDWEYRAEYIRTRTLRKSVQEFDVHPEWATEAALDPHRLVGKDPASKSGQAVRIVGYSQGAERVLAVIVIPKEHPPAGDWWGVNAWAASETDRRRYERGRSE